MTRRNTAWMGKLALTAVLSGAAFVAPAFITPATTYAQDAVTDLARSKFKEGLAAYDARRFDDARALFLQAYALKRHPAVLLNLGQSELKSGYVEDGGNHLQQFLREHKTASAEQKTSARAGITQAQKSTGFVVVISDTDGAHISIDGKPVGISPLLDPVFVKPGKHTATANRDGKVVAGIFTARRGTAVPITLQLGMGSVPPTPGPAPSPEPPRPQPGVVPTPGPSPAPAPLPYPQPLNPVPQPGMMPQPGMGMMPPSPRRQGREPFLEWFTHKPIAWVGAGVTGVGVIGALSFGIAAGVADGNASSNEDAILVEVQRQQGTSEALADNFWSNGDGTGTPQPCGTFDDPSTAASHYAGPCQVLRDNVDARDGSLIGVAVFTAVGVAAAAGTIIYYFVDTAEGSSPQQPGPPQPQFAVLPILTPTEQGIGLVGQF